MWEFLGIVLYYGLGALLQVLVFLGIPIILAVAFGVVADVYKAIRKSSNR